MTALRISMNNYEFIQLMEEKKEELKKDAEKLKEREIVNKILLEIKKFKEKKSNFIYIYYGLRGIGKTTSLMQAISKENGMYVDGTSLSYYNLDLVKIAKEYSELTKQKILYLDEITEIKNWGKALKILHDIYKIKIIATGSSAIKIAATRKEIIRRSIFEEIPPLTFREYLKIKHNKSIKKIKPGILLSKPSDFYIKAKAELLQTGNLANEFREYLKKGFPLNWELNNIEKTAEYTIDKIIADDFPEITGFNIETTSTSKKIINSLAIANPGETSLEKLSKIGECSKTTIAQIINTFAISSLLLPLMSNKKSTAKIRKEAKYLFSSPAIRYGLTKKMTGEANIGAMREDSFVNSAIYSGISINYITSRKKAPDYEIFLGNKKQKIEIGGQSKTREQISKGIILIDGENLDYKNNVAKAPLYLAALTL